MLSKNKVKLIRSLGAKKYRSQHGLFVAEGDKSVAALLAGMECALLVAKPAWMATQGDIQADELLVADEENIRKVSFLQSPGDVLAVFRIPSRPLDKVNPLSSLVLVLDGIQDPGNLGTMIRTADWFGIDQVVCSPDCADVFSPKAVQSTMGALANVWVHYTDTEFFLEQQRKNSVPLYGTFLDGENIYGKNLSTTGIIVMGSEGSGVRPAIEALVSERLYIPGFPAGRQASESLNVAAAAAIVCAEFRRRMG